MKDDLILRWASERGTGNWPEFVNAHDWLFNSGRREGRQVKAGATMHALALLGHVEIDWGARKWAVAPSSLTLLPHAGAHAILTGGRQRQLLDALQQETQDEDRYFCAFHEQDRGPDAVFIAASDDRDVEELAGKLGINYETCVSERLARMLPALDSYLALCRSTPGARGYGVQRFDTAVLEFRRADSDTAPGFYRYEAVGQPEFRFVSDVGDYYRVDRYLGIHAELAREGRRKLWYQPDTVNGTLVVPYGAQLPALHARTAALCTGLMPLLENGNWHYPNVPRETGVAIATALGQGLIELPEKRIWNA